MNFIDYTINQKLGNTFGSVRVNVGFIFDRLQCSSDNVLKIPSNQGPPNPPFQARFCQKVGQEHLYLLASEEGSVLVVDSDKHISKRIIKQWTAHNNAIFDISWIGHERVITASGDKTSVVWDVVTGKGLVTCKGHGCSIKSISLQPQSQSTFATGSRDGKIMLWDIRTHNQNNVTVPNFLIEEAHDGASTQATPKQKRRRISQTTRIINPLNSITSVLFQDEHVLLSTGCSDRKIKGWDLRYVSTSQYKRTSCLFEVNYPGTCARSHGYTNLVLHPNRSSFFASCTDSVVYQYGSSTSKAVPKFVCSYYGHKSSSFFVKMDISYDGKYLLSGSTDCKGYIWDTSKPGLPIQELTGHEAEVTSVAWSPNQLTKVITCSDDERVFQWEITNGCVEKQTESGKCVAVGQAVAFNSKEVTLPASVLSTPKHYEKPISSQAMSPITPSSSRSNFHNNINGNSPSIMHWLTPSINPRTPKTDSIDLLTPPKTPSTSSNQLFTPVKKPRLVLCDLGQSNANGASSSNESFSSLKMRSVEEKERLKVATRRTLLLEDRNKNRLAKENLSKNGRGKSPANSNKNNPKTSAAKNLSYGIKRFFSVLNAEKDK